jgi:hypothetical protein
MEYGVCFDLNSTKVLFDGLLVYFKPLSPVDIYYGVSSSPTVTSSFIKSNFLTEVGYIGSPTGRLYVFPTGYTYRYWCIQDDPNLGYRVISNINNGSSTTVLAYDSFYSYYQTNPTPPTSITYGKIFIDGIRYRIYRTIAKTSSYTQQYVYSF